MKPTLNDQEVWATPTPDDSQGKESQGRTQNSDVDSAKEELDLFQPTHSNVYPEDEFSTECPSQGQNADQTGQKHTHLQRPLETNTNFKEQQKILRHPVVYPSSSTPQIVDKIPKSSSRSKTRVRFLYTECEPLRGDTIVKKVSENFIEKRLQLAQLFKPADFSTKEYLSFLSFKRD